MSDKDPTFIVGFSCNAEPDDTERGLAAGMNLYKNKPMSYATVKEIVTSLADKSYSNSKLDRKPVFEEALDKQSLIKKSNRPSDLLRSEPASPPASFLQFFVLALLATLLGWCFKALSV